MPAPSYHNIEGGLSTSISQDIGEPPSYEEAINPNGNLVLINRFSCLCNDGLVSLLYIETISSMLLCIFFIVGCTVILGVTIIIPICMIVMGLIYLHDCPQGEYIPVYLLVGGIFGILKQLLHLSTRVRQREEEREEEQLRQSPTQTLLNCFMLGWFIIGSVWVYKEYEPNYDPSKNDGQYCNRNLYLFAFWLITSVYILLGTITLCLCSLSIASIVLQPKISEFEAESSENIRRR
ncbi:hypothetical protein MML48_4g00013346 [Holotrichia oblita]|uniref:Uncharacterized protein n=1 Tax=Holotrichia oblita TaxID=644536 RepID=A0ACB9T996_HOLOL|nr:hypothetical protein MML48_4g00013346 [Holotrichia oblita]